MLIDVLLKCAFLVCGLVCLSQAISVASLLLDHSGESKVVALLAAKAVVAGAAFVALRAVGKAIERRGQKKRAAA